MHVYKEYYKRKTSGFLKLHEQKILLISNYTDL